MAIDEGMIGYKGRLSFKQYMPAKPTKYGIKLFAICDSVTGYCLKCHIYTGREDSLSSDEGFTFNIVNKLISPYILYNHILYTDNFYTSIKLAKCMRNQKTHLVGTVRKHSKLFPKFWKQIVLPDENIKLVDCNGIVGCRWRIGNKRDLHILSTITNGGMWRYSQTFRVTAGN